MYIIIIEKFWKLFFIASQVYDKNLQKVAKFIKGHKVKKCSWITGMALNIKVKRKVNLMQGRI